MTHLLSLEDVRNMGARACAQGKLAAAALDPEFMQAMKSKCLPPDTLAALTAWNQGWHEYNAAQPVPGVTGE